MNPWLYSQQAATPAPRLSTTAGHAAMPLGVWASDKIPSDPPDTSSWIENLPDWRTVALLVTLGYIAHSKGLLRRAR